MTNHVSDNELELFLLDNSQIDVARIKNINKHLTTCSFCKSKFEKIISFYSFIEENYNSALIEDQHAADKVLTSNNSVNERRLLDENIRAVKVYDGKYEIMDTRNRSLFNKLIDFIKINPIRFSGSLALVGLIIGILFIIDKPETKFFNPTLAVIKDNVLSVYNELGDLLWKKAVPGMVDFRTDLPADSQIMQSGTRELLLDDLDNDGINELLIAGKHSGIGAFSRDTLYCFDPFGKMKWQYGCGSFTILNTPRWKHNDWFINDFFTVKTKSGKKLFVVASTNYAPVKIFELDFNAGTIKQEFYNSGGITASVLFDVDNDGYNEIIIGGINNAFSRAFLAVFRPDSLNGFSPSTETYIPSSLQKNSALKYILFPTTNYLKAVSRTDYNMVEQFYVSKEEKTITAYVQEAPGGLPDIRGAVLYIFDMNWKVQSVVLADNFVANYNRLLTEGKIKEPLDSNYTKNLAERIKYLK